MSTINDRIKELIEYQGFTAHGYEKKFGFSRGTLSNIIAGRRTKPGFDVLEKLITSNERVSVAWLMKGDGAMLVDQSYTIKDTESIVSESDQGSYVPVKKDVSTSGADFLNNLITEFNSIKQRLSDLESK